MALSAALRTGLLAQVACGDPELKKFLDAEIDFMYSCQNEACTERLRYAYTQLALIEAAQIFARNKIDTATRVMAHVQKENFSATARRNTDAEATATGSSCIWNAATSQQHFVRDSTDDQVAFSETNYLRTAERLENGFDRSSRNTTGSGSSFSRVIHTLYGRGGNSLTPNGGQESRNSSRTSQTAGGTNALVPLAGTKWDTPFAFTLTPPFIQPGAPGPVYPINFPPGQDAICPEPDPDRPFEPHCTAEGYNSMGYGYHGKYRFSISVPAVTGTFSVNLEWDQGKNERQYFHCSSSTVTGQSTVKGAHDELTDSRTYARPQDNYSSSAESSTVIHFVRKHGESTRRGTETIDAEDTQRGYADGNAHSESDRNSQGNSFTQRRSESLTVGTSSSTTVRTEHLTDDEVRRSYGQISAHLGQLWTRIFATIQGLEREFAAVAYGASMCCLPPRVPCCTSIRGRL